MSVHEVTVADPARRDKVVIALHQAGRAPVAVAYDPPTLTLTFDPDLTAQEQQQLAEVVRAEVTGLLTRQERNALEPVVDDLRVLRQRSDAQWTGLTAAQRDADLIRWCRGLTDVLRAVLRD